MTLPGSELGSSPHARGARVGVAVYEALAVDHPRMHGEHDTWGGRAVRGAGIIPACTGSTLV